MAILGYCPGNVSFGGIREPARRKHRNCVQISMPCGFKPLLRGPGGAFPNGPGKIPQKTRKAGMGLRWWLGAFCVLVLWTAWDRDTVAEKNIKAFELRELNLMDPTGLSLLANGWHESLPAKCSEHGGKKGPCSLGF